MIEPFPTSFFKNNRERLRTLFSGTAPIVITASSLLQQKSDMTHPFRQDSTFWYLTGIEDPDVVLVMDKGREYLILPPRSKYNDIFDGDITPEKLTEVSGIENVMSGNEGWKLLGARIKRAKHVAIVPAPPVFIETYSFYTNPARAQLIAKLKTYNEEISLLDLTPHIIKMRSIKQSIELDAIKQAIDITIKTIKQVKKVLPKQEYEYQVEAMIVSGFRSEGAREAFGSIVSAGKNTCVLHYQAANSPIADNDLVLIDVGAEVNNYAADITRTYAYGKASKRQKQVYDTVKEVQSYAFGLLKPGVDMKTYEEQVHNFMGEKLRELGLISSIDNDSVRKYFPTSTSHFLGLDTHDIGDYKAPLEPGMVLTVEPGIYIPEEGIGVRIEDDVLINGSGIEILTTALPTLLI